MWSKLMVQLAFAMACLLGVSDAKVSGFISFKKSIYAKNGKNYYYMVPEKPVPADCQTAIIKGMLGPLNSDSANEADFDIGVLPSVAEFQNSLWKVGFTFVSSGADDFEAMLKLGVAMEPAKVNKKFQDSINSYYNTSGLGNVCGEPKSVHDVVTVGATVDKDANFKPLPKGKMSFGVSLSGLDATKLSAAEKTEIMTSIADKFATLLNVDSNFLDVVIDAFKRVAASDPFEVTRRLLASNVDIDITAKGLSPMQADVLKAKVSDPSFSTDAAKAVSDTPGLSGVTVGAISAPLVESSDTAFKTYTPPEYTPSATVVASTSPNELGDSIDEISGDTDYLIGVVQMTGFFFVMGVLSYLFFPCFYCCCCKGCCCGGHNPRGLGHKFISINFILAVLIIAVAWGGAITGFAADAQLKNGAFNLKDALTDVDDVLVSAKAFMTETSDAVDALKVTLNAVSTCDTTKSMADSVTGIPELPLPDLGVASLSAQIDEYIGYASMGGLAVGLLLLACACFYSAVTLCTKLGMHDGPRKSANCFVNLCCAPFMIIFLGLFWIIAGVLATLGIIFADLCIEDPIAKLVGLIPLSGDMRLMLNYLVMCTGAAPAMLLTIVDMQLSLNDMAQSMPGLATMFKTMPGCQTVDSAAITLGFENIVNGANGLIGLASCSVFNPILVKVVNLAVCTDLQASFYNTAVGIAMLGFCVMFSMFNFAKVDRHQNFLERKIAPEGTEMGSVSRSESLPLARPA
jgi:hypothetical protein